MLLTDIATAADSDRITGGILKIAGVVVLGAIMSILDITVVNVALPTFQTTFGSAGHPLAYSTVAWTVTGYTLALATVIPVTGWAADRFGTKRLYMTALALFTAGSALCSVASSISMLIGFRVLQGLGGGMLMPLGMMIITRAAGPRRMGRLMAILGVPMLLGPIGGPILGGWLIDSCQLALDLPHQRPDRRDRAGLRARGIAEGLPAPVGVLRLPRRADDVPGPGPVPLRRLLDPRGGQGRNAQGARPGADRPGPGRHLRSVLVQTQASAAGPAAVPQPRPRGQHHHDVPVRGGILRRPAAGTHLLPADPRRVRAQGRPAGGAAGHRRNADHADRRYPVRQVSGRPDRAFRSRLHRGRHGRPDPDQLHHVLTPCCSDSCSSWAWAWAAR